MSQLHPYLTFNNNCREAMNFYKDILGGELSFIVVGDSPLADQMPPQYKDAILHSELKTPSFSIMGSDMSPEAIVDGNATHLCLVCDTPDDIRALYDKLAAGGKASQPIHEMFFGLIGSLTDKYGKSWVLQWGNDK